ncbi:SpoIIE family protein phosphatase [Tunturibacter empetritectus]|uniref:Sigma-B regulation protein RsbU (Phosphoserine phosphatase) n=2 Tax=Tunturiibacter empetritectus TaxID=3069691 RepID=A0A7W8MPW7_9BACT|nr:SpoIIE family protein phosphatase [Edaphobacter lichenicola]MBB5315913.1 sigma-B regulation protein RsbU (phosphoserine phosphatase) [Edaphobacter lichenicola]
MPSPIKPSSTPPPAPEAPVPEHPYEGDYRPPTQQLFHSHAADPKIRVEPLQVEFLHNLADALNTTLDLNTLMHRVADLVRAVIDYKIFAILLVNERAADLRMRFQIGHSTEVERMRIKLGRGVAGQAALQRKSLLVEDVTTQENYIDANPNVRSELAVPLVVKNKVIGVLDLQSETIGYFTMEHQRLLELVASRMAIAIENARLYTRVSRQAQTLAVLNDISREITSILDPDDLLERIGQLLKRVIDFHMFTILLWNDRTQLFEHRFSSRFGERVTRERTIALGEGLIGTAAQLREPILAPDVRKDPRYVEANPEVRSELAIPLVYKGEVIGVLDLEHTRVNYYNDDHQRTLSTLASQVAISIANAKLYQRIHEEEQRMERDLDMARQVQLRLMPSHPPKLERAEIAARFVAARSIGGDVFDYLDYGSGRIAIAVGDVSGKAAPAALYAALVSGILRSLAPRHLSPAAMLVALNDQLQERKLDSQYVTMLMAVWDDNNQTLQIANAGSVQPLFVAVNSDTTKPPSVRTIKAEGFPLGLFPNAEYEEFTLSTRPGDLIVFFSDGIVDAVNATGDMFGDERLTQLLESQHQPAAQFTVDAVLQAVTDFQAGTAHFDDETIVVLRATGQST